jgi:DNA polymerase III subunit chi
VTHIKFYTNATDRLMAACKIIPKALAKGHRVIVYAPDAATSAKLDTLLWTHEQLSFIPHVRAGDPLAPVTPVVIAASADEAAHPQDELLLNLDDERPAHFARFENLVEIIDRSEHTVQKGRERFKFYKDRGYAVEHIALGQGKN